MNKVFKVVWSESTGTWVAVSEITKAHGKTKSKKTLETAGLAIATLGSLVAMSEVSAAVAIGSTTGTTLSGTGASTTGGGAIAIGSNSNASNNNGHVYRKNPYNELTTTTLTGGTPATVTCATTGAVDPGTATNTLNGQAMVSVAIGNNSTSSGGGGVAIGDRAKELGGMGVAIGTGAYNSADVTNAQGTVTKVMGSSVAIGAAAFTKGNTALAIGRQAAATEDFAQAIGPTAAAVGGASLAVGHSATATGNRGIAIGSADYANATATTGTVGTQQGTSYQPVNQTFASGTDSIAMGSGSRATATDAMAFAAFSNASGVQSLAIGRSADATAANATAIGANATADSLGAIVIGTNSHLKGTSVAANGVPAGQTNVGTDRAGDTPFVVIGYNTSSQSRFGDTIVGAWAKSENPDFSINQATVIGNRAIVYGDQAVAVGADTRAIGNSSISIGGDDVDKASRALAPLLNVTIPAGATDPQAAVAVTSTFGDFKANITSQTARDTINEPAGNGGKYPNTASIGDASVAIGPAAQTLGVASNAIGVNALAQGLSSTAIGTLARSNQVSDIAIGTKANATSTAGGLNNATDPSKGFNAAGAVAIGQNAQASGNTAHLNRSNPLNSVIDPLATASDAVQRTTGVAIGNNTLAASGVAIGDSARGGSLSVVIGPLARAENTGNSSVVIGQAAQSKGNTAIVLGRQAVANQTFGLAVGNTAASDGKGAMAVGHSANATGYRAMAFGSSDLERGAQTTGIGGNQIGVVYQADAQAKAAGQDTIAFGSGANALANSAVAVGAYAKANANRSIAIGGIIQDDLKTKVEDGTTHNLTTASGLNAIAIGSQSANNTVGTKATGDYAVALGTDTLATGVNATSIGRDSVASAQNAIAVGVKNNVSGENSVAIGLTNTVTGTNTFVLGSNVTAATSGSVVLGQDANTAGSHDIATVTSANVSGIEYGGFVGTVKDAGRFVSVGAKGDERKIINLAAGNISATSTEAINGSQLYAVMKEMPSVKSGNNIDVVKGTNATTGQVEYTVNYNGQTGGADGNTQASVNSTDKTVKITTTDNTNGTKNYDLAVNVDGTSIVKNPDGNLSVANTSLSTNPTTGAVNTPPTTATAPNTTPDGDKLVNATTVANAINNSGFNLTVASGTNGTLVNPGDTVDLKNTDGNILITKGTADNNVTFDLNSTVTIGNNPTGTNNGPIKIDGNNGTITGLAPILPTTPTTVGTQPTNPAIVPNQAATISDVLNAGWNLQEKGVAKDFVRPYDTVNFVNGNGTAVNITTDGTKSDIKYDVVVDDNTIKIIDGKLVATGTTQSPTDANTQVTVTQGAGITVTEGAQNQNGTKNYVVAANTDVTTTKNPDGTVKADDGKGDNLVNGTTLAETVNKASFDLTTGGNTTTQGVKSAVNAGTTVTISGGKAVSVSQTEREITINTLYDDKTITTTPTGDLTVANTTLSPVTPATGTTPATVSPIATPTPDNSTKFVNAGDLANTLNNLGFNVEAGAAAGTNGTNTGGKVEKVGVKTGDTVKFLAGDNINIAQDGQNFTISAKVPPAGTPTAPVENTTLTVNNNGQVAPQDPATNGDKLVNATTVTDAINNTGFKVSENGTTKADPAGTNPADSVVNAGDVLNFADGQGTKANVTVAGNTTTVKFDTPVGYVGNTPADNTATPTNTVKFIGADAAKPVNVQNVNSGVSPITGKDTDTTGTAVPADATKKEIADAVANATGANLTNAVNVGDLQAVGAAAKTEVKSPNETIAVTTSTAADGHTVYNVDVATTNLNTTPNGTVEVPATPAEGAKVVNATTLANVINNVSHNVTIGRVDTDITDQKGKANATVKAGETLTFNAGKNLVAEQDGTNITFATANDVTFNNVTTNNFTVPTGTNPTDKPITITKDGISAGDKPIANVSSGLTTYTAAEAPKTNLVNLTTAPETNAVTVGDLQKMGWIVQSDKTTGDTQGATTTAEYTSQVKNADQVKFVGTGAAKVSGKTGTDGVNTITVHVDPAQVDSGTLTVNDGTANNGSDPTQPAGTVTGKPSTTNGNVATVGDVANAVNNSGFSVAENGTKRPELVNAGDIVNFADGQGTKANVTVAGNTTTVKFDTPVGYVGNTPADNTATPTNTVKFIGADAKPVNVQNVNSGVSPITGKDTDTTGTAVPADATKKEIADAVANATGANLTNAVNVGDLQAVGAAAKTEVKSPNETITVTTSTAADGHTVYNVDVANTTLTVSNGTTPTGQPSTTPAGKVEAPKAGDENKVVNAGDLVNVINNSGFNVTSDKVGSGINTGSTSELVNPGETVKFIAGDNINITQDGANFTVATSHNPTFENNVTIGGAKTDNTGAPVVTANDGNTYKAGDVNPDGTPKQGATPVDPADVTTAPAVTFKADAAKPATNNPTGAEPTTALNITSADGKPTQITGVGSTLNKTPVETNPLTTAGSPKGTADLVDLVGTTANPVNPNAVATVGDLQNMGWVVSTATGEYKDVVKNSNEVKFIGTGGATVTGKTNAEGVREITIDVQSPEAAQLPVVYTNSAGDKVVKANDGKYYKAGDVTNGTPNANAQEVPVGDVIASMNTAGNDTKTPMNLSNVKGNLDPTYDAGNNTIGADGKPTTTTVAPNSPEVTKAKDAPTAEKVKEIYNNAATVGDVLNAGWNIKGNGADADFVKPYDTVDFVNGTGTTAVVTTNAEGTATTVTYNVNVDNTTLTTTTVPVVDPVTGQPVVDPVTGQPVTQTVITTNTTDLKPSDGTAANATNPDGTVAPTGSIVTPTTADGGKLVNATTVANAINNSGFNVTSDKVGSGINTGSTSELVNPGETVKFIAGDNINITQDGANFTVATSHNPTFENNVTIGGAKTDNTGAPVVTANDGNTYKAGDVNPDGTPKQGATPVDPADVTTAPAVTFKADAAKPATNNPTGAEPTTALNITSADGKPTQITGVGSTLNKTPVETNPLTNGTIGKPNVDLVDLVGTTANPVNPNAVATVGDLQNMGWVVSTASGDYKDTVKNANEVKFVGTGGATVTGKTNEQGVREIFIDVKSPEASQLPVVYTNTAGEPIVKAKDGNFYKPTEVDADGNPKVDATGAKPTPVEPTNVIASMNSGDNNTTKPTQLSNVKGNLDPTYDAGNNTIGADGKPTITTVAPNSPEVTKAKDAPTAEKVKEIYNNAATVGDVLNAGWNIKGNGADADFVKPYDTVDFVNGTGTTAVVTTNAEGTATTVTYNVNVDNTTLTTTTVPVVDPVTGQPVVDPVTGQPVTQTVITTNTTDLKPSDGTAANATNPDGTVAPTGSIVTPTTADGGKLVNATTVANAINNSGFNVTSDKVGSGINTGSTSELVNPGETVKFIAGDNINITQDGANFTVATSHNPTFENNVTIGGAKTDNTGAPVVTANDGNTYKAGDVNPDGTPKQGATPVDPADVTTAPAVTFKADAAKPATNNPTGAEPTTALNITSADGKPTQITGVGSTLNKTPVETNPLTNGTIGKPNVDLVDLVGTTANPVNPNAVATVGDLQNMGWVVSTATGEYKDVVKNSNEVKFIGTGGATVTGKTNAEGVREITIDVQSPEAAQLPVVYTNSAGDKVVKANDGKYYKAGDVTNGTPNANAQEVPVGDVIASMNTAGNDTKTPMNLSNVKGNLEPTYNVGDNTIGADGKPTNVAADKPTIAQTAPTPEKVKEMYNNAATVGDVLNAGWNIKGNGADADFVKPYDTVDFVNGTGTTAVVTTDPNGTTTTVTFNSALGYVGTDSNITTADGKPNAPTNTVKLIGADDKAPVLVQGANSGVSPVTNFNTPNTGDTKIADADKKKIADAITNANGSTLANVANIGDVQAAAAAAKTEVASPKKTIDVTTSTAADGHTVYNVDVANTTLTVSSAPNATNNNTPAGKVEAPKAGDENKVVNAGDLANVINNTGFSVTANGQPNTDIVKAGETVNFVNGTGTTAVVTTSPDGTVTNVTFNSPIAYINANANDKSTPSNTSTFVGTEPVQVKNVASGVRDNVTTKPVDAKNPTPAEKANIANAINAATGDTLTNVANIGDLQAAAGAAKTEVKEGTNMNVTSDTGANGQVIYTVATKDDVKFNSTTIGGNPATNTGPITIGTTPDGNNTISGLTGNLPNTYNVDTYNINNQPVTKEAPLPANLNVTNAATVGDILNSGWNLRENNTAKDFIKAYDTVNFVNGSGTVANITVNDEGTVANVTYNVDVDGSTVIVNSKGQLQAVGSAPVMGTTDADNGKALVGESPVYTTAAGDVLTKTTDPATGDVTYKKVDGTEVPAADVITTNVSDAGKAANVGDIVSTINKTGFHISGNGQNETLVNPGEKIDFINGNGTTVTVTTDATTGNSTIKVDSPIAYVNATNPADTSSPTNTSKFVGAEPVQVQNVASGVRDNVTTKPADVKNPTPADKANIANAVNAAKGDTLANVANIGDLQAAAGAAKSEVASPKKTIDVTTSTAADGHTIYNVDVANTTLAVSNAPNATNNNTPAGKVVTPTGDNATKFVNAGDLANAINNAGFTLSANNANGSVVNAGEVVDLNNTDGNIVITKATDNNNVTFNLADTVKIGNNSTATNPITINSTTGKIDGLIGNLAPTYNAGDNTIVDGKPTDTPVTTPSKSAPAPTPAEVKAMYNNAATVGDVLNAGWNVQGNGEAKDFVKPYDTVNFVNGTGTTAVVDTDANGTVTNITFNSALAYVDDAGNTTTPDGKPNAPSNTVKLVGGNTTAPVTITGATSGLTPTPVDTFPNGIPTGTTGTPVPANLINFNNYPSNPVLDSTVATVGDLRNMGWVVSAKGNNYSDAVRSSNVVEFVGEGGVNVTGVTDANGKRIITISGGGAGANIVAGPNVNVTNTPTTGPNGTSVNNYTVSAPSAPVTANPTTGKVNVPTTPGLANATDVANAINNVSWNSTTAQTGTGVASTTGNTSIKAGDTMTFTAGNNMNLTQNGQNLTIATKDNVTFSNVNITTGGSLNVGPNSTINAGNNKIQNVAPGELSPNSTDAVNGSQLYQVYNVVGGNNQNITTVNPTPNTTAGGNPTITVSPPNVDGTQNTVNVINGNVTNTPTSNNYTMTTYNVEGQKNYITNNVIEAIGRMNEQGIQFFHTNDGTGKPRAIQGENDTDSSASGAYATAVGHRAEAAGSNAIAMGRNAKALGEDTISIGNGNIVTGNRSGAFGDPSVITGDASYSIGNDNTISTNDTFVLGSNVSQTKDNSVFLGNSTAYSYATGTDKALVTTANNAIDALTQASATQSEANATFALAGKTEANLKGSGTATADAIAKAEQATRDAQTALDNANTALTAAQNTATTAINAVKASETAAVTASIANSTGRTAGTSTALSGQNVVAGVELGSTQFNHFAGGNQTVGVVSVGSDTETRRIQNVAPGLLSKDSTDAINGSQLYAIAGALNEQIENKAARTVTVQAGGTTVTTGNTINYLNGTGTTVTVTPTSPTYRQTSTGDVLTFNPTTNVYTKADGSTVPATDVTTLATPNIAIHTPMAYVNTNTTTGAATPDVSTPSNTVTMVGAPVKDAAGNVVKDAAGNNVSAPVSIQNVASGVGVKQPDGTYTELQGKDRANAVYSATGPTLNNAVNVGDLKAVAGDIHNRIGDVEETAYGGVAQALATAGLPQAYLPGKSLVAVGAGTYKGETGYAVSFSSISDGGNWIIKGTGSGNSNGNIGGSIGVGYQW